MDYKEKYEQALERAKYALTTDMDDSGHWAVKHIFPELEESRDEEIRKWIIDDIKYNINYDPLCNSSYKKEAEIALAWLEKQGESNPYSGVTFKYNGYTWGMCARDGGVDILLDGKLIEHVEKQDKQEREPTNVKDYSSIDPNFGKSILVEPKSDGECHYKQNDTNKQEHRFKVDDWIIHQGTNNVYYIKEMNDTQYHLESINDSKGNGWNSINQVDKNARFWTIQDAKDGDVLVTEKDNIILMYHSMCTIDTINVHCCLDNKFICANLGIFDIKDVHPATKEQCDLLFQKMREAGYEWDADSKKLKKIEQKFIEGNKKGNLRLLFNREILKLLSLYIEQYPDTRFGQMLYNFNISVNFNEESDITYKKLNKKLYNL